MPRLTHAISLVALSIVGSVAVAFAASPNWIRIDWPVYWLVGGGIIGAVLISPVTVLLAALGVSTVRMGIWCFLVPAILSAIVIWASAIPALSIAAAFSAFGLASLVLGLLEFAARAEARVIA